MTRSFFQAFEEQAVDYLVISGQATVLYGAADFSEDLDLWIEPSSANIAKVVLALRQAGSRFYKLTPPLTEENLRKGHGFHFECGAEPSFFLDIMGQPPRVGSFAEAASRRITMESDWGMLPVIGVMDLAEVKKTQRLRDYDVITALAVGTIDRMGVNVSAADVAWACENIFSISGLNRLVEKIPGTVGLLPQDDRAVLELAQIYAHGKEAPADLENQVEQQMQQRMTKLQRNDREYWKPIVSDLKRMNTEKLLAVAGAPV